ncbi:hypothetical protein ANN_22240 [Periplaneta americana]|uniref:Uncharacterized protein n=1 Tax=Periplaneta americana TaxID=6978 RepID=A0ABQ8S7L6_PERAM|nr:hypothetical protein ANN_22240 [Periplaneta americana]
MKLEEIIQSNNAVEGWHNKFQKAVSTRQPSLWKFIDKLIAKQHGNEQGITKLLGGQRNMRSVLNEKYINNQERLLAVVKRYDFHRVRHALAISLKTLNWEIPEEVHCVSSDGSFRRADIIAINGRLKRALVLDPTIRFERNLNQATEVDIEKKSIYEPCLPYLSRKYNVPLKQWSVIGLLFGSRGSITKFTWNYLKELHIPFDYVMSILINIIKDSLQILHHHLYFN